LSLTADKNTSFHVWSAIQSALQSGLNSGQDADVFALAAMWEPPQETISRWRSRVAALALKELIADASSFALALERFSPRSGEDWRPDWHSALSDRLVAAISHLDEEVAFDDILGWLTDIDRLLSTKSGDVMQALLAHCGTVSEVESLARLRQATGTSFALPDRVVGDALLHRWITDAFSDGVLTLFGPHAYAQPIELIRSAHQSVLRDVGLKSLEDAASGSLSLQGVKTSALASVGRWQAASEVVRAMRPALAGDAMSRVAQFDTMVGAWRALASQRLAHPAPSGQRLVVLDTSALMQVPDLLSTMRRGDIPVVPRRVLEELDGIKESAEEDKAQKARSAIRSLERAGQGVNYESEVLDLLPPDWEPTSDNRILSVALYLRLSDVLVVTGDRNFRNKARAENIAAMLPEEYRGVTPNQGGRRETGRGRR
jgi:rRNA-processing protein FCF1